MDNSALLHLINSLSSLPGISSKHAKNIAYFLIKQDSIYINKFLSSIVDAKKEISLCPTCNYLSKNNLPCSICQDQNRDKSKLCVVSNFEQLEKIEETKSYNGQYFVTLEEINPKVSMSLSNEITKMFSKTISANNYSELILATNYTAAGELTASYLKRIATELQPNINVYRLAIGLPVNSTLDYADVISLTHAIKNKFKF